MRWFRFSGGTGISAQKSVKNLNSCDARVMTPHLMRSIWQTLANMISALKSIGLSRYQRPERTALE